MNSQDPLDAPVTPGGRAQETSMSPQLWLRAKELFGSALHLASVERSAFLEKECRGDKVLRAEVESLLLFAEASNVYPEAGSPERCTLAAGTRLGEYEVVSLLGPGGFGGAYRARDLRLHRDVAIKVLPASFSSDPAALRRFEREALAAARLNHPHIVTIYSIEQAGDVHLIIMELVEGQTLDRVIPDGGLPVEKLLELSADLSEAVAAAHDKGIIHRDLKPGNIMVSARGSIKVLDFGIAKITDLGSSEASDRRLSSFVETEPGMVMGTIPYMSPEQLEGRNLDRRTDIFSLGEILYQMATGERPFHGKTRAELISSILLDQPKPLGEVRPDLPTSFQSILERCLAKQAAERYSAIELHDAIQHLRQELLSGLDSSATNVSGVMSARSIAVLPLENLSRDPEQEYFAEGLTEALINTLATIGKLRVISRTSVLQYKGVHKPLREIARELGVDTMVEGTVMRDKRRVRITARLIDALKETHLWAESYERDLRDVLALQSEIAQAVAREVRVKLTPRERKRLAKVHAVSPEAYEAYLKGRYHWNIRSRKGHEEAVRYFQQAIAKDPAYAPAYAGLADAVSIMGLWGLVSPKEGCGRTKELAKKALEMDSSLAEAHTSLAWATLHYEYDFSAAEREFERSIELNSRYATAHQWFGMTLGMMGRYEEAYTELQRAIRLDPQMSVIHFGLAFVYWSGRRYDQAIERCGKALDLDSYSVQANCWLGLCYTAKLMCEPAIDALKKAVELSQGTPIPLACLGEAYAAGGYRDEAREVLRNLLERPHVTAYFVSRLYAALGENDEAFHWLRAAYQEHSEWTVLLMVDPRFDELRADSRFQDLLLRMNFSR